MDVTSHAVQTGTERDELWMTC